MLTHVVGTALTSEATAAKMTKKDVDQNMVGIQARNVKYGSVG
jgi:hypothetical protein